MPQRQQVKCSVQATSWAALMCGHRRSSSTECEQQPHDYHEATTECTPPMRKCRIKKTTYLSPRVLAETAHLIQYSDTPGTSTHSLERDPAYKRAVSIRQCATPYHITLTLDSSAATAPLVDTSKQCSGGLGWMRQKVSSLRRRPPTILESRLPYIACMSRS